METVTAITETPKGSMQKFDYNRATDSFELSKIMPAGMMFPYDFGFIPDTKGGDGDPLDVVIISEAGTFPGCRIKCRIIGCILPEQKEKNGETVRNDRYIAIPEVPQVFSEVKSHKQLSDDIPGQLIGFFVNYNRMAQKKFKPIKIIGPFKAMKLIRENRKE